MTDGPIRSEKNKIITNLISSNGYVQKCAWLVQCPKNKVFTITSINERYKWGKNITFIDGITNEVLLTITYNTIISNRVRFTTGSFLVLIKHTDSEYSPGNTVINYECVKKQCDGKQCTIPVTCPNNTTSMMYTLSHSSLTNSLTVLSKSASFTIEPTSREKSRYFDTSAINLLYPMQAYGTFTAATVCLLSTTCPELNRVTVYDKFYLTMNINKTARCQWLFQCSKPNSKIIYSVNYNLGLRHSVVSPYSFEKWVCRRTKETNVINSNTVIYSVDAIKYYKNLYLASFLCVESKCLSVKCNQ